MRASPTRPRHGWLLMSALAAAALVALTGIVAEGRLRRTDARIARLVHDIDWGWLVPLMRFINSLGVSRLAVVAAVAVVAALVVSPTLRMAWVMVSSLVLCVVLGVAAKLVMAGAQPAPSLQGLLAQEGNLHYPSNHAVAMGWLGCMLVLAVGPRLWPPLRPLAWALAALIFVAVFLARVWGGEHSATDMVAGLLLTGACATFVVGLWDRLLSRAMK